MSLVDELVTVIRFETQGKKELDAAEKRLDGVKGNVEGVGKAERDGAKNAKKFARSTAELNKEWLATGKTFSAADSTLYSLGDSFKSLGLISTAVVGGLAAWAISGASGAQNLANMAFSTQLTTKELQRMSSVYQRLGGDADAFAQDALRFQAQTGRSLDFEMVDELSRRLASLSEREALNLGRAIGLSDDSIRIWRESAGELARLTHEAELLGHVATDAQIKSLTDLNKEWKELGLTAKGVATDVQASAAGGLSSAFKTINELLINNRGIYQEWGASFGATVAAVTQAISGEKGLVDALYDASRGIGDERDPSRKIASQQSGNQAYMSMLYKDLIENKGYTEEEAERISSGRLLWRQLYESNPENQTAKDMLFAPIPTRAEHTASRAKMVSRPGYSDDIGAGYEVYRQLGFTEEQIRDIRSGAYKISAQEISDREKLFGDISSGYQHPLPPSVGDTVNNSQLTTNQPVTITQSFTFNGVENGQDAADRFDDTMQNVLRQSALIAGASGAF